MFQKIYNNSNNNKLPSPIFIDLKKSRVDPNPFEFEPLITVRFLSSFNVLMKYHMVTPSLGLRLHVRSARGNRSALGQVVLLQPLLQPRLLLAPKRHRLALGPLLRVRDLNDAAELRPQLLDREHQQPILAVEEVERPAAMGGALHGVEARHAVAVLERGPLLLSAAEELQDEAAAVDPADDGDGAARIRRRSRERRHVVGEVGERGAREIDPGPREGAEEEDGAVFEDQ
ncbi:hypothetical protein TorRG33x02_076510 [Trema orientale]|uniref:Uncharacterized protein n=1 Tax=Trema orientale TaxID=63057 RepID=A0A2P5FFT9_TREOI|nr:hypothetical protein TorRG33x02_076510 [Trema orientale]